MRGMSCEEDDNGYVWNQWVRWPYFPLWCDCKEDCCRDAEVPLAVYDRVYSPSSVHVVLLLSRGSIVDSGLYLVAGGRPAILVPSTGVNDVRAGEATEPPVSLTPIPLPAPALLLAGALATLIWRTR